MKKKYEGFLTDEEVEREIERLSLSELVALARREVGLKYKRRRVLYTLRNLEKRGRTLLEQGITREVLDAMYNKCDELIKSDRSEKENPEMKANYTVTTKNGKCCHWRFSECKSRGGFGNGIYIAVLSPSGDLSSIDCRYMTDYSFNKACVDYLLAYYGDNLDELSEDDEI